MKGKLAIFSLILGMLALVSGFCFSSVASAMEDLGTYHAVEMNGEMMASDGHHGMADSASFMPCCEKSDPDHGDSLLLGKIENGKVLIGALGVIADEGTTLQVKKQQKISLDTYFSPPEGEKLASVIKIE